MITITEGEVDEVLDALEPDAVSLEAEYERFGLELPNAIGWLTAEHGPLMGEEHDYLLYLGAVLLQLAEKHKTGDVEPPLLEKKEEKLWEVLNEDHPHSLEVQAEKVDDDNAVNIFLIDALSADDELPFLTSEGAILIYARLLSLARALKMA